MSAGGMMKSIVLCGPALYRNAFYDFIRLERGDFKIAAHTTEVRAVSAIVAHSMPDAVLIISGLSVGEAEHEVRKIRKVDLDVNLVWWSMYAEIEILRERMHLYDVKVALWDANPHSIANELGIGTSKSQGSGQRPRLTRQEQHILQLAAEGLSNRAIANRLSVSESTVKNHLRHVSAKFNTSSRAQSVWQAVQWGYLTPQALQPIK
jgi:DNA-binding NarL/FixJ family response regulator